MFIQEPKKKKKKPIEEIEEFIPVKLLKPVKPFEPVRLIEPSPEEGFMPTQETIEEFIPVQLESAEDRLARAQVGVKAYMEEDDKWYDPYATGIRKMGKGFYGAAARTAGALDKASMALAEWGEKITGIPKEKLRGGAFKELEKDWDYYSEKLGEKGIGGVAGEVFEGVGGATWDIPAIMTFGKFGLPIYGGLMGGAEGGLPGAVEGAISGALIHKSLGAIGLLPSKARLPAFAGFGFATTPGGIKERTAGSLTWTVLGLAGGQKKVTVREFMDSYPGIQRKVAEKHALKIIRKIDPTVTPEEIKKGGGAKKYLDTVHKGLFEEEIRQSLERADITPKQLLLDGGDIIPPEQLRFMEILDKRIDAANKQGKRLGKKRIYNTMELCALEAEVSLKDVLNNADLISQSLSRTGMSLSDMIQENKYLFRYVDRVEDRAIRPSTVDVETIKETQFLTIETSKKRKQIYDREVTKIVEGMARAGKDTKSRAEWHAKLSQLEKNPAQYFIDTAQSNVEFAESLSQKRGLTEIETKTKDMLYKEALKYADIAKLFALKHPVEMPLEIRPYALPVPKGEQLRVLKQTRPGAMPIYVHEALTLLKNFESAASRVEQRTLRTKAAGWFKNAIYTFEEFPELKELLYDPMKLAENNIIKEAETTKSRVRAWTKVLAESPEARRPRSRRTVKKSIERIGTYAIQEQVGGKELLKKEKIDLVELSPTEYRIYDAVRAELEGIYHQINQTRRLIGLDPMPYVENYFTFFKNLETLKEEGYNPIYEPDRVALEKKLNAVPFEFARERKGADTKVTAKTELRFFDVYSLYRSKAMKFMYKSPIIAKGRMMLEDFEISTRTRKKAGISERPIQEPAGETITMGLKKTHPVLYSVIDKWLDHQVGATTKATGIEGKLATRLIGKLNRNVAMWVLSWNFRSAFIQPTALRLTYMEIGAKWLSKGAAGYMSESKRNFVEREANVILSRMFDVHAEEIFGMQVEKALMSKAGRAKAEFGRVGMKPLQALDLMAAKITWLGAYEQAIAPKAKGGLGLDKARAKVRANDVVTKTQASAQPSDIAPIQRGAWGKTVSLFQTFVINEWNYLYKNVAGLGTKAATPKMSIAKRATQIGRLVAATAVINAIYEGVFHLQSPYPSPEWAIIDAQKQNLSTHKTIVNIGREMAEQIPIIGGSLRWSSAYRTSFPAIPQLGIDAFTRLNALLTKPELKQYDIDIIGKILGIPSGGQLMKYIRRRRKGMSHVEAFIGVKSETKKKFVPFYKD